MTTLNVDVRNKPAVKQIHLTMDSRDMGECCVQQVLGKKCTSNWRNELNREQMDILEKDLKGLKVRYELPKGSKRQYKFNGLVKAAKRQAEDP